MGCFGRMRSALRLFLVLFYFLFLFLFLSCAWFLSQRCYSMRAMVISVMVYQTKLARGKKEDGKQARSRIEGTCRRLYCDFVREMNSREGGLEKETNRKGGRRNGFAVRQPIPNSLTTNYEADRLIHPMGFDGFPRTTHMTFPLRLAACCIQ